MCYILITVHVDRPYIPVLNLTLNLNPRPRIDQGVILLSGNGFLSVENPKCRSLRQQSRRFTACEIGSDRLMKELKKALAPFVAGGDGGPHPLVISSELALAMRDMDIRVIEAVLD